MSIDDDASDEPDVPECECPCGCGIRINSFEEKRCAVCAAECPPESPD